VQCREEWGGASASPRPSEGPLGHLARLLREMAGVLDFVAQNQLAGAREQSDMSGAMPSLLSTTDVATILRVDPKTVRRWREEGHLPSAIQVGGVVRWKPEDIETWLEDRREA